VIHDYRETLLSSLPPSPSPSLTTLLAGLYSLLPGLTFDQKFLPPPGTSTHLLHLSPKGAILPHVDNLEASGSVILGLSLGAERTMRLKKKDADGGWEVRLPSGSVYLQR
jgi:alkylated DNA repair protein alkB family protein 7